MSHALLLMHDCCWNRDILIKIPSRLLSIDGYRLPLSVLLRVLTPFFVNSLTRHCVMLILMLLQKLLELIHVNFGLGHVVIV